MEKLVCEGNEILIKDYLEEANVYTIDTKFQSKEGFEKFAVLYEEYGFEKGIFRFEIGEKRFRGWFGQMLYDENYNVRVYVGIYDENERLDRNEGGNRYNIGKSVIGIGNAIRELCGMLVDNGSLNLEQKANILHMMSTPETKTEFFCLVDDLHLYLKSKHMTIEDIKNRR